MKPGILHKHEIFESGVSACFLYCIACVMWLLKCYCVQLPVRAPVELLLQVHLVKVQVDMIAPVTKLMTVPVHMSVEVRYHQKIWNTESFVGDVEMKPSSFFRLFTAQCTLVHMRGLGIACRPSVRPSVRLSVRPSVTLVDCDHISWKSWKLTARTISPTPSLFVAKRRSTYSQDNMGKFWGD